jgi:3-hydroxymyristoyl/3-hydroxydecanoyl-(acyl carrier protein) dehydratase
MMPDQIETLARTGRKRRLFEAAPEHAINLGRSAVERLLPHRDPFLFVDRITTADLGGRTIAGERRIDIDDPVFTGHFPGEPIYPGVLQLETMGQLGLCLFGLLRNRRTTVAANDRPQQARALKVHHATFLSAVRPGEAITALAKVIDADAYTGVCAGQLLSGDTICSFAVMEVYFVDG